MGTTSEQAPADLESNTAQKSATALEPFYRLEKLSMSQYKGIPSLQVDFPEPQFASELDATVLGSKNGGGKTSVLECCALLYLAQSVGHKRMEAYLNRYSLLSEREETSYDLMSCIRSGEPYSKFEGTFDSMSGAVSGKSTHRQAIVISHQNQDSGPKISCKGSEERHPRDTEKVFELGDDPFAIVQILNRIFSISSEPLLLPPLLFFNSYRRVAEDKPDLDRLALPRVRTYPRRHGGHEQDDGEFKTLLLRAAMAKASLFDNTSAKVFDGTLDRINTLLQTFAQVTLDKIRPLPGNRLDFRVVGDKTPSPFSFDALSSGQKEIISTLFLIWYHTHNRPSLVLLDEPEVHLNDEWHREFMLQLQKLAPQNQYIIATHSERIFGAVPPHQRIMLEP